MHKGKYYPFHEKYWVPNWRYWPGRAPGWAKIDVGGPQIFPELLEFYTIGWMYSLYGEVSVDGQDMTYVFDSIFPGLSIQASCPSRYGVVPGLGAMLVHFHSDALGDFWLQTESLRPIYSQSITLEDAEEWNCWGTVTAPQQFTSLIQFAGQNWSDPRP